MQYTSGLRQMFGALKRDNLAVSAPKHAVFRRSGVPFRRLFGAETPVRREFGTPKHSHEPVSVRARRAERRAEPCVRRAEATQSAETSFTAVSADQLETAFRRRTSAEICNGVLNLRRTGVSAPTRRRNGTLSAEKQRVSAPKQPKCPVSARRKSASNH